MIAKRMLIAVALGILFGLFCAYGTLIVRIPGLEVTPLLLLAIVYNRALLGFVVGLADGVRLLKGELANAALRGAILGVVVSVALAIPGGWNSFPLLGFGLVYGLIADVLATKFGS
jgi:hypothetical protein